MTDRTGDEWTDSDDYHLDYEEAGESEIGTSIENVDAEPPVSAKDWLRAHRKHRGLDARK